MTMTMMEKMFETNNITNFSLTATSNLASWVGLIDFDRKYCSYLEDLKGRLKVPWLVSTDRSCHWHVRSR